VEAIALAGSPPWPFSSTWSKHAMADEPSEIIRKLLASDSPLVAGLLADLLETEEGRAFALANPGLLVAEAEYIDTL